MFKGNYIEVCFIISSMVLFSRVQGELYRGMYNQLRVLLRFPAIVDHKTLF